MAKIAKYFVFLFLFFLPFITLAQQASIPKAPPSTKVQRRMAKKKWKDDRRIKRDAERNIKEHDKKFQTKAVRKKMRKDKAKSKRINEHKREFFLKRWLKK